MAAAGGAPGCTSFQRRPGAGPRLPAVPGTRPSVRHGQLLLSSGLPSLDCVLGGGVAVGTLLLIEEDKYGLYSDLLFKYFLAEGVVCGHDLFIASAKEHPDNILKGTWSAWDQVIQKGSLQTSVDSQSNTDSFIMRKLYKGKKHDHQWKKCWSVRIILENFIKYFMSF